jgi:type IV pilus assembly protein PilO
MALLPQDPHKQKLLLLGIVPLLLAGAYYQFVHTPRAERADELESRVERITSQNDALRAIVARFGTELPQRLAMYQEHMHQLEELIPRREDVPRLIHQITEVAMRSNVDLEVIRPGPEQAGEYYSHQTFELQVTGDYHAIGEYLTAIGSLGRIVRPYELKLSREAVQSDPNAPPKLRAAFRIETYVMPDPTDQDTAGPNATT